MQDEEMWSSPERGSRQDLALEFRPKGYAIEGWWKSKLDPQKRREAIPRFAPVYVLSETHAFVSDLRALGTSLSEANQERRSSVSSSASLGRRPSSARSRNWNVSSHSTPQTRQVAECGSGGSLINGRYESRPRSKSRPSSAPSRRSAPGSARSSFQPAVLHPSRKSMGMSVTNYNMRDAPARREAARLSQKRRPHITNSMYKVLRKLPEENKRGYCYAGLCGHGGEDGHHAVS